MSAFLLMWLVVASAVHGRIKISVDGLVSNHAGILDPSLEAFQRLQLLGTMGGASLASDLCFTSGGCSIVVCAHT